MAKGMRKITGFLWALILAVVSFFVIFLFFPDVSQKFFGVSLKKSDVEKAKQTVEQTVTDVTDKAVDAVTGAMVDAASSVVK